MENNKNNQPEQENPKHYFDGYYIQKMEDGYYKAFSLDGVESKGANLPINICIMALKGQLPSGVTINPSDLDIEIEPSLAELRKRWEQKSPFYYRHIGFTG
jgi:hypothetical protein